MKQREIKFRAYYKGSKMQYRTLQELVNEGFGLPLSHKETIVMQYTDLKDIKNREIYEGDLMQALPSGNEPRIIREVQFIEGKFVLVAIADWNKNKTIEELYGLATDLKIIGNIWENPELLTQANI